MLNFKTLKLHNFQHEVEGKKVLISDSITILKIILSDKTFIDLKLFVNTADFVIYNPKKGCFEIVNRLSLVAIFAHALSGIKISYNSAKIQNVVDQLLVSSHAIITPITKYFKSRYIAFKNGVLDLKSLSFFNHDPKYATLYFINETYVVGSSPENFFLFLLEFAKGDLMIIAAIRCMMSIIIRSELKFQKFFVLLGPGGTGKSQLINILINMVGQEGTLSTTIELLCKNNFEIANLRSKTLLVLNDSSSYRGDFSTIKRITGNDLLQARIKYIQEPYDFFNQAVLIMAANHPPFAFDSTGAITRRMIVIPAINVSKKKEKTQTVMEFNPESDKFEGLVSKEISSIITWSLALDVELAGEFLNKFYMPYIDLIDIPELEKNLGSFIDLHLEAGEGETLSDSIKKEGLYDRYLEFSEEKHPLPLKTFFKNLKYLLEEKGIICFPIKKKKGLYLSGIQFIEEKQIEKKPIFIIPSKILEKILHGTNCGFSNSEENLYYHQQGEENEVDEKSVEIPLERSESEASSTSQEEEWKIATREIFKKKISTVKIFAIVKE